MNKDNKILDYVDIVGLIRPIVTNYFHGDAVYSEFVYVAPTGVSARQCHGCLLYVPLSFKHNISLTEQITMRTNLYTRFSQRSNTIFVSQFEIGKHDTWRWNFSHSFTPTFNNTSISIRDTLEQL